MPNLIIDCCKDIVVLFLVY